MSPVTFLVEHKNLIVKGNLTVQATLFYRDLVIQAVASAKIFSWKSQNENSRVV